MCSRNVRSRARFPCGRASRSASPNIAHTESVFRRSLAYVSTRNVWFMASFRLAAERVGSAPPAQKSAPDCSLRGEFSIALGGVSPGEQPGRVVDLDVLHEHALLP